MRFSLSRETWGGIGIAVLGAFLSWEASGYPFGSLQNAGAGFFPLVFSVVLFGLGLLMIVESVAAQKAGEESEDAELNPLALRSLAAISAAILAFYLIVTRFGLVPATVALVVISALAEPNFKPLRVFLTALILCFVAVFIFVYGFRLPLEPFRWG